jgi:hypothetical protein
MEHYFIAMTPSHSDFYASADDFSSEDESLQAINSAESSVVKPSTNWLDELSGLPSDWALLPLDGNKKPIDPASGLLMKGWARHQGFSSDELQEVMPLAVGVLTGPVSGGLLAVDFDGPGSEERFQHIFGRPSSELPPSLSWSSGKPERRQVAFNVDLDWWDLLKGIVVWQNNQNKTILELRWKGHQSVIAGAHPETMGYFWLPGCSPADFSEPAMAPDWLLIPLLCESGSVQELPVSSGEDQDRAFAMLAVLPASDFTDYHSWLKVGMALHSVDPGLLNSWVAWSAEMQNFDEAECLSKWESFGAHHSPVTIATLHFQARKYGYKERSSTYQKPASTKLKIQQAKEVCAGVGKITWPLQGFAATGLVLLAADQGVGKSTLLYSAAEAIQEGKLFLGHIPSNAGRVLVLQGDEPVNLAKDKFKRMGLRENFDIVYVDSSLDLGAVIELIESEVYSTLIVDSLTTILMTSTCTTVDYSMVEKLYSLNREACNHGVLVLMTAHLNKPPKDGSGHRQERRRITWGDISGLSTIGAAVNDCWGLTRRVEGDYSLHCLGKRYVEAGIEWILEGDQEDYSWTLKSITDGLMPLDEANVTLQILDLLNTNENGMSAKDVNQSIGLNVEHIRRCLCRLFDDNKITRSTIRPAGRGRPTHLYRLAK